MTRCIVVPLDGSSLAEAAVPRAVVLSKLTKEPIHLVRVHVPVLAYAAAESPVAIPDPAWDTQVRGTTQAWLVKKAGEFRAALGVPVTFELRIGAPGEEVVAAARERNARMIVCTTHGTGGWAPQWLGSVADDIIRHSDCPVVAMTQSAAMRPVGHDRIFVPLDGSGTAAAILPHVRELARAAHAAVDLYRVVAPPWVGDVLNGVQSVGLDKFGIDTAADLAKVELDRVAEDLRLSGVQATSCVEVATNPTRAILDRIKEADPDLVAMCTHGRGLSRLFLGSVADKVLRASGRPLLCWHPPRTQAPDDDPAKMFATAASGPTA
jgi:nucleotide-binding universal stress UspA family protein